MVTFLRSVLILLLALWAILAQAADLKGIEQELSDSMITTKITAKYTQNKNLNPLKISVSTLNGIVTLTGFVKDHQALAEAITLAKATKGVTYVDADKLEIKPVNTVFTDTYITVKVEAAVLKAKLFDDESIPLVSVNAKTNNGIVTLTGEVKNNASIIAILKRVNTIRGVKKIISELQVSKDSDEASNML